MSRRKSRRMSRALASATVVAAAASTVAFTSTSAQAAPRFTNGHIAWTGNTAGWSESAPDGSNVHVVTPTGGGYDGTGKVTSVTYSPDGTKVAFSVTLTGDVTKAGELWVADVSGANAHRLVGGVAGTGGAVWSPDGSKLYFSLYVYQTSSLLYVVNADGSGLTQVPGQGACKYAYSPTVAPSGRVAFTEACPGSSWPVAVAYDPGATELRKLTGIRSTYTVAYSPDGRWIAYVGMGGPNVGGLFIVPAGGGLPVQITSTNIGGSVTWAPDGASLLVWNRPATGHDVLSKVAAKPNSPLVPIAAQTDAGTSDTASWQSGPSTAPARPAADRIGGADRIDTAVRASQWSFDTTGTGGRQAGSAVITRSDTFADALAGNALAAEKDGPLFMTDTTGLDPRVSAELVRILPPGATVYILGGDRAISNAVDTAVAGLGFRPMRVAGDGKAYADDRYGTAQAIADTISGVTQVPGSPAVHNQPTSVFVATGDNYPDALAAGAAAAHDPAGTGVVMLSAGTGLLPWTRDYLANLDPKKTHIYTVGGQATTAVANAFPAWKGLITPLAGANRFDTAYKVATSTVFAGGFSEAGIATAANWPDALSGGALIGLQGGPLLLSDTGGLTAQELSVLKTPGLGGLAVFGGPSVVTDKALAGAADYAFGVGGWDKELNRKAPALK